MKVPNSSSKFILNSILICLGFSEYSKSSSLTDYFKNESLPEIVLETAGSMMTQKQAIEFVAKMGQICYLGTVTEECEDASHLHLEFFKDGNSVDPLSIIYPK